MIETSTAYKRHRFPARLIAHAVWLYFRFPLSLRLVEELLLERGIVVQRGAQIDRLVGDGALGVVGECPRADPGCPPCPSS